MLFMRVLTPQVSIGCSSVCSSLVSLKPSFVLVTALATLCYAGQGPHRNRQFTEKETEELLDIER